MEDKSLKNDEKTKNVVGIRSMAGDNMGAIDELRTVLEMSERGSVSCLILSCKDESTGSYRTFGFGSDPESYAQMNLLLDVLKNKLLASNMREISFELIGEDE